MSGIPPTLSHLSFQLSGQCQAVAGFEPEERGGGVVVRSKHICGFSDHIKDILPPKGGLPSLLPALARSLLLV